MTDGQQDGRPESEPTPAGGGAPGPTLADFTRFGLYFYGLMAIVAVVWRVGFYQEPILFASASDAERGVRWVWDLGAGLAVGLAIVAASNQLTRRTGWGDALARSLAAQLGDLSVPNAVLLAFASGLAEEMLFRGALQPRAGWLVASLLFGLIHYAPRRELLPWTGFAVVVGFVFGGLFALTGNLVAPVTAHIVVNGINLPLLIRDYGSAAGADRERDEGGSDGRW